jgi:undecaprenyl pyrophosphate synthase
MSAFFRFVLSILHILRVVVRLFSLLVPRRSPRTLNVPRTRVPKHLALALVTKDRNIDWGIELKDEEELVLAMFECVRRVVEWCEVVGIEVLTVYDREGELIYSHTLYRILTSRIG